MDVESEKQWDKHWYSLVLCCHLTQQKQPQIKQQALKVQAMILNGACRRQTNNHDSILHHAALTKAE